MTDTVLIVDDEESVRRTFQEWLTTAGLDVRVFAVGDAESALLVANEHPVDLAVLDWNLGSGSDGLRLLEDLVEFRPDVVAILITGFAHQATPLEALRKGVRDYLDKDHPGPRGDRAGRAVPVRGRPAVDPGRPAAGRRRDGRRAGTVRQAGAGVRRRGQAAGGGGGRGRGRPDPPGGRRAADAPTPLR